MKGKQWKKGLCLAAITVFMSFGLTACGDADKAASTDETVTDEAVADEAVVEEEAGGEESSEETGLTTEMTDTIRWFNATYAILTKLNGLNLECFGGMEANEMNTAMSQASLEDSWGLLIELQQMKLWIGF